MSVPIPVAPLFANAELWSRAANNLLNRAEGLLRDEMDWRRARPCHMAEYFRLAVLEGAAILRPYRRARHKHWRWRCTAEHQQANTLCPLTEDL